MSNGHVTLVLTREERLADELGRLYDAALLVVDEEDEQTRHELIELLRRVLWTITDDD